MSSCLLGGAASLSEDKNSMKEPPSTAVRAVWQGGTARPLGSPRGLFIRESFSFFLTKWWIFLSFCFVGISHSKWWLFDASLECLEWRERPQVTWASRTSAGRTTHIAVDWGRPIFFVKAVERRNTTSWTRIPGLNSFRPEHPSFCLT